LAPQTRSPGLLDTLACVTCRLVVRFQFLRQWDLDAIDGLIALTEKE